MENCLHEHKILFETVEKETHIKRRYNCPDCKNTIVIRHKRRGRSASKEKVLEYSEESPSE